MHWYPALFILKQPSLDTRHSSSTWPHKVVRVENASVEPSLTAGAFFYSEAGRIIPSAETTVIPVGGFSVGLARQGCRFRRLTRASSTTLSFCGELDVLHVLYNTLGLDSHFF